MKLIKLCLCLIVLILGLFGTVDVVPHSKSFSETVSIMIIGFGFVGAGTVLRRRNAQAFMIIQHRLQQPQDAEGSPGRYDHQPETSAKQLYPTPDLYSTFAKNDLMRGCSILSENRSSG